MPLSSERAHYRVRRVQPGQGTAHSPLFLSHYCYNAIHPAHNYRTSGSMSQNHRVQPAHAYNEGFGRQKL